MGNHRAKGFDSKFYLVEEDGFVKMQVSRPRNIGTIFVLWDHALKSPKQAQTLSSSRNACVNLSRYCRR